MGDASIALPLSMDLLRSCDWTEPGSQTYDKTLDYVDESPPAAAGPSPLVLLGGAVAVLGVGLYFYLGE